MKIVQAPDIVLSAKAQPIKKITKDILDLIEDMKHTLLTATDPEGVGLAAPQVGKSLQLFIIKPEKEAPFSIFMNTKVKVIGDKEVRKGKSGHAKLEGCLSIKDIWGTVARAKKVQVTYTDETSKTFTKIFTGWPATIIQHEQDHLDGILFPRRVLEQGGKLYKSHKDKNGEEIFDLVEL